MHSPINLGITTNVRPDTELFAGSPIRNPHSPEKVYIPAIII